MGATVRVLEPLADGLDPDLGRVTPVRPAVPPLVVVGRRWRTGRSPLRGVVDLTPFRLLPPGSTTLGCAGRTVRAFPEPGSPVPARLVGAWTPGDDPERDPLLPGRNASLGTTRRRGGTMRGLDGFAADGSAFRVDLRNGGWRVLVRGDQASPTARSLNSKRGRPRRGDA